MKTRLILCVWCLITVLVMVGFFAIPEMMAEETSSADATEKQELVYTYNPTNRREPFRSLLYYYGPPDFIPLPPPDSCDGVPLTLLQQFESRQFRVIGIIIGGLGEYARVLAPDGKTYTVKVGTFMGKFCGKVESISENVVTVKEIEKLQFGTEIRENEVETRLYLNPLAKEKK